MRDIVLIIAPQDDFHAITLKKVLEARFDADAYVWDLSTVASSHRVSFSPASGEADLEISVGSRRFLLSEMRSVWWRRVPAVTIDDAVAEPRVRRFCTLEYEHLLKGAFASTRTKVINNPISEYRALYKPLQLTLASRCGLTIPKTLMSNDPDAIRRFWTELGENCIYKTFGAPSWTFLETRSLTREDLKDIDAVRHAPIIVQEKIDKDRDIRVNIFGDEIFPSQVYTRHASAELDWRVDLTAQWSAHALPAEVVSALRRLMSALGLDYGCVDLRRTPDGQYVFFEINPAGQFLFAEIDAGQNLLDAMAILLLGRS